MPKVSIIIPVYNVAPYLRQALDSCINQTLKDIEIICIDDCSTDNSLEILKEYAQKDGRIVIIEQKVNQGQGVARNMALQQAKGNYIMYLDPDDWFELDACEKAYNQIVENNNDIVFFNHFKYKNETKEKIACKEYEIQFSTLSNSKIHTYKDSLPCVIFPCAKIYRRNFLLKNNCLFASIRNTEDWPFATISTMSASSISVLNKPLYNYRIFDSKQNTYRKKVIEKRVLQCYETFVNRLEVYNMVKDIENNILFKKHLAIRMLNLIINAYNTYSKLNKQEKPRIYTKTREIFLKINNDYSIDDLRNGIKFVSPQTNLSPVEIEKITQTSLEDKILISKISEKKLQQYKDILKYPNSFIYDLFVSILPNIFSIRNQTRAGIKHKVITILGIKIKIKINK